MQILVLYFSKGGNTEKLAEAIIKGVESVDGVDGVLKHTDDVTKEDFVASAGIIAGEKWKARSVPPLQQQETHRAARKPP